MAYRRGTHQHTLKPSLAKLKKKYDKLFEKDPRDEDLMSKCRDKVFKRDKYKCQMPGCKKEAQNAHHIIRYADSPSLRYDEDNMISLCKECHKQVTGNEANYIRLFALILSKKDK